MPSQRRNSLCGACHNTSGACDCNLIDGSGAVVALARGSSGETGSLEPDIIIDTGDQGGGLLRRMSRNARALGDYSRSRRTA